MAKGKKTERMIGKENTGDDMHRMAQEMMKGPLRVRIEMPVLPKAETPRKETSHE